MLEENVPNPLAKNPNFNTHKVFAAIGLILIAAILVLAGIWIFVENQSGTKTTDTKDSNVKISTPSAKKATKSAEKDETADWKIYSDSVLKFSIKHPKDWTVNTKTTTYYEVELVNYDASQSSGSGFSLPKDKGKVKLSITKDTKSESVSLEDYVISKESTMTTTVSRKEILVDNRKSVKRVWEQAGFGTHATTYIQKDPTTVYFVTEFLHYQESLYDLLISTFKFL